MKHALNAERLAPFAETHPSRALALANAGIRQTLYNWRRFLRRPQNDLQQWCDDTAKRRALVVERVSGLLQLRRSLQQRGVTGYAVVEPGSRQQEFVSGRYTHGWCGASATGNWHHGRGLPCVDLIIGLDDGSCFAQVRTFTSQSVADRSADRLVDAGFALAVHTNAMQQVAA